MSHELRTPLNAILGFAQILRRESGLGAHAHTGLAAIQSSGEHLLQLIVDLLDLSRVEAGRLTLDARPTQLAAVLDGAQAIIRVRAQEKALSFVVEIAGGTLLLAILAGAIMASHFITRNMPMTPARMAISSKRKASPPS